jgi:hypothetical protein
MTYYDVFDPDHVAPGVKHDAGKPDYSLLPLSALEPVVRVLEHGAAKYGRTNYLALAGARERYLAACLRHLAAFQDGEAVDPESGLPHLAHAICGLIFVLAREPKEK